MKKKKILFIVEAMGGGVFTYIVDLANELINSFDIYIAYAMRPQTPEDYKEKFDKRIHLIEVHNFTRSIDLSKDLRAFFEIKRIEKEIQPDIIHLHSSKAGALGRWAFNGNKIPLFYTPHGYSFLMANYGIVKRTIFRIVEELSAKKNCTVISCSPGEHQVTLELTKNATFVDNGINIHELDALTKPLETDDTHPFTVFTLGRICYQKNPQMFNKVANELPNIKFLWIGDGELRDELKAPNIKVTGWVERDTALQYLVDTDVFMLTSLWEGLPISLLEAMYMRKLCVVSDVIGNRDVIHTSVNGFVCDKVQDFITAILAAKEEKQTKLIDKAYKDVLEHYNTDSMADKYSKIYRSVLKQMVRGTENIVS